MPWMLLREPVTIERGRARELGDAAWVMVGGLSRALQQAGMAAALLDASPRPRCMFTAGLSVANALLAAGGERAHFERGWEQLRARRFVVSSALRSYRLLAAGDGLLDDLAAKLAELGMVATDGLQVEETPVHVAGEEGFAALPADHSAPGWRKAVKATLRHADISAPLIAHALGEAVLVASRVIVLGADRPLQSHPDVEAALRAAGAHDVRVDFITTAPDEEPSLVQYLLPGSGAADRLMASGRKSAEDWLKARVAAQARQDDAQGVAAASGVPSADAGAGDGALERGEWRSEVSDASSWPK